MDITNEWKTKTEKSGSVIMRNHYSVGGVLYWVDGKKVVLHSSQHEIDIAMVLCQEYGKTVELIPRVNYPQGVQTPDYLIDGERYDLKTFRSTGPHTFYNLIAKKKNQSPNFIFDISACSFSDDEIEAQIKEIYSSTHTRFVFIIVIIKNNTVVNVYKRQ